MLLGASSKANGLDVDLDVVVDSSRSGDAGVPGGEVLLAYATAVHTRDEGLGEHRDRVSESLGHEALVEAAATIAIFNGLVRVADGTGIQLDPSMLTSTTTNRARLGIDQFGGAASSVDAPSQPRRTSENAVRAMFD